MVHRLNKVSIVVSSLKEFSNNIGVDSRRISLATGPTEVWTSSSYRVQMIVTGPCEAYGYARVGFIQRAN